MRMAEVQQARTILMGAYGNYPRIDIFVHADTEFVSGAIVTYSKTKQALLTRKEVLGDDATKIYHMFVKTSAGEKSYLAIYPMTHEKCMVMKSKSSRETQVITQLEEVN